MNRKHVVIVAAAIILAVLAGACTRSASGGPADLAVMEEELPNPVSTQSELMKEIIASTQTAMAMPLDGEETEDADVDEADAEQPAAEATKAPKEAATPIPLPTSTQGPPPAVELGYNTKSCGPNIYICVKSVEKDQTVVLQASQSWLLYNMDLTFKMGPDGLYDFSKYIVAGTAKYKPDGTKGYGFEVELNIPDSLRGTENIVVRLETNNVNYWGSDIISNK
jgi:hypothetical protein